MKRVLALAVLLAVAPAVSAQAQTRTEYFARCRTQQPERFVRSRLLRNATLTDPDFTRIQRRLQRVDLRQRTCGIGWQRTLAAARAAVAEAHAIQRAASNVFAGGHSAVGVVSWYDCSSQGTASGHQYSNGAAWFYSGGLHLPFGTVVHASYQGRSTTVIVTDTGYGTAHWLMDFCPDAFADLAPLSAGWIDGVYLSW